VELTSHDKKFTLVSLHRHSGQPENGFTRKPKYWACTAEKKGCLLMELC